jgi:cysteinyl-tRNA synthetase
LLEERIAARAARDWAKSDLLRKEIEALGFNVLDGKDGTSRLEPKP